MLILMELAILAGLVVFIGGYASTVSLSSFRILSQDEGTEGTRGELNSTPGDVSPPLTLPASDQGISQDAIKTPPFTEGVPRQNISAPTPFPLPKPIVTPEPTATPTRVIQTIINIPPPTLTSPPPTRAIQVIIDSPSPTPVPTLAIISLPVVTPTTVTVEPEITHVVIISIDGLRPDALDLANTPTLDDLRAKGAYCPEAQTVKISRTLPSHASMLSGMRPEKHGLLWGLPYIGWPGLNGPTLFTVAHEAGLSTAMVFGKEKLNYLVLPNSVDKLFGVDTHDPTVKEQAVAFIQAGLPNILFIHFPDVDWVGHDFGWMSANQLDAITFVDNLIGDLVAALEGGGYLHKTLLIITADHGGHDKTHGDDSPLDRTIPWLAVGPGVPPGMSLTGHIDTYDTAATVLYALDLPAPEGWDGKPILEIFPSRP